MNVTVSTVLRYFSTLYFKEDPGDGWALPLVTLHFSLKIKTW